MAAAFWRSGFKVTLLQDANRKEKRSFFNFDNGRSHPSLGCSTSSHGEGPRVGSRGHTHPLGFRLVRIRLVFAGIDGGIPISGAVMGTLVKSALMLRINLLCVLEAPVILCAYRRPPQDK